MSRLREWQRRWKLAIRGECRWDGCGEPRERWFDFCGEHLMEDLRQFRKARRQAKFERDVAVIVEASRRVQSEGTK